MTEAIGLGQAMRVAVNRTLADLRSAGRGVSPAELARLTGISDKSLRRRLDGSVPLLPDDFETISHALGVPVDEMWRRARRVQEEDWHAHAAEQALAKLPPDLADVVRRVDREQRDAREDDSPVTDRPSGVGRSATTGS